MVTFVRARLLGLPLLTLEGKVVVTSADRSEPMLLPAVRARHTVVAELAARADGDSPPAGNSDLRRAALLIERSARTLAEARKLA